MASRAGLGILCALCAAALYGLMPNFVRAAYNNGVPAAEATLFRTTAIALILGGVALFRGESFAVRRAAIPAFAAQSAATLVISVSYLMSVQYIPVGLAVLIFFTFPVLIMLLSPLVEGHAPGLAPVLVTILAFAGLSLAIGPSFGSLDARGLSLAAAASAGAVVQFYSGRSLSRHMTPAAFASLVHAAIWPATLAVALYVSNGTLQMLPGGSANGTAMLFLCGVALIYVIAYLLQMLSLRFAAASRVAPFYNLEPVVTMVVAMLLLGERFALAQYAGGALVLVALVLANVVSRTESKT